MVTRFGSESVEFTNELVPNYRELSLCPRAEPYFNQALRDLAFVIVNDLMLIKAVGNTVGVPLREVYLPGGKTEQDAWYEIDYGARVNRINPASSVSEWSKRDLIRSTFITGGSHVNLPGVTRWMKHRPVNSREVETASGLRLAVAGVVTNLKDDTPMPGGISRNQYFWHWQRNDQLEG